MAVYAKVVKLNPMVTFSALTEGALYQVLDCGQEGRDLDYEFALIDDDGDKMPFKWSGDMEAEFERVEM
jgi:hypothetical protein